MRNKLRLLALLIAVPLWAANGDITACRVVYNTASITTYANGWTAECDETLSGTATGGTYAFGMGTRNSPTSAKAVFTVTRPTGHGGTTTTLVYGVPGVNNSAQQMGLRLAYPNNSTSDETTISGGVTIRFALSENIYSGDTVTGAVASGLYTKTGVGNNSWSGTVTNNSTRLYPPPIGRWATVGYQAVTGASFVIEATVFHHFGISDVVFHCNDGTNDSGNITVSSMTISSVPYGDQHAVLVYAATIPTSALTQGLPLTCNFIAYPAIGNVTLDSSSTAGEINTAVLNGAGALYAANDTGIISGGGGDALYKVLTVSSGAVATLSLTYGGTGYSTATAVATTTGGAQPGTGTGLTLNTTVYRGMAGTEVLGPLTLLNDKAGTYGKGYAVVDVGGGGLSSAATTYVFSSQASAESSYTTPSHSYTTYAYAALACKAYITANFSPRTDAGGCVILSAALTTYPGAGAAALGTMKTWMTITRVSTIARAGAGINVGTIASISGNLIHIQDITVSGSSAALMYSGVTTAGTGDKIWVDNTTINTSSANPFYAWALGYATANTVTSSTGSNVCLGSSSATRMPLVLIRGNAFPTGSATTGCWVTQYAVLGNINMRSVWQQSANTAKNATSRNSIVAFNTDLNWTSQIYMYEPAATLSPEATAGDVAIIQNIFERVSSDTSPLLEILDQSVGNSTNVLLWHNVVAGARVDNAYNYQQSATRPLSMFNWSYVGNIFNNYNYNGDTSAPPQANNYGNMAIDYSVGFYGNYFRSSQSNTYPSWLGTFLGLNSVSDGTLGFTNDAAYNDISEGGSGLGNGDYHIGPTSSGLKLIPLGKRVLPFDLSGNPRLNSGNGSAGAYEAGKDPSGGIPAPVIWGRMLDGWTGGAVISANGTSVLFKRPTAADPLYWEATSDGVTVQTGTVIR